MSFSTRSRELPTPAWEGSLGEDDATDDQLVLADAARARDAGLLNDGATAAAEAPAESAAESAAEAPDRRGWRRPVRLVTSGVTTAMAFGLLLFALLAPDDLSQLTPGSFARIPMEGLLGAVLALVLPATPRRVVVVLGGMALGLLTVVKLVDTGSIAVLSRPWNLVLDWVFLSEGLDFVQTSLGTAGATGVVIAVVLLVVAVPLLVTLSTLRLTRLMVRHNAIATGAVTVLAVVGFTAAHFGLHIVPGEPLASRSAELLAADRARTIRLSLHDREAFAKEAAVDAFRDTPGDQLLTGLRGKDVVLAYVESYGRSAIEDPALAPHVNATLAAGTRRLREAGYASRSGFLTSSTAGGGSKLAQATLLSGLQIDNRQRYRRLTTSNRMTLAHAFQRAGWRSVAVRPGVTQTWVEGSYFGYDKIYAADDLGYQGPMFGWATMPDQYVMSAFERFEHAKSGRGPVLAEIPLVSSHLPWAPTPSMIDWDDVGDGSVFAAMRAAGKHPDQVWPDTSKIRTEYRRAVEYSLNTLISYVETYGDQNLVMVFLGDHQPVPLVAGKDAGLDVPITIVAKDPAVMDQVEGWGWTDGLKPGPAAPVWPMSDFRDRFLTAFGPDR